ncbi:hypothetical protein [Janthinobacterium sp.]|uniref:hypothetical protein n=1 Tax=Janthinobacterium sp. TaxID=1871054 RepID=UPI0026256B79|nr:hypothetical protein [Janthinobacterium sp.]
MHSFKQFLSENAAQRITLEQMLDECKPFIDQSHGAFLYRGIQRPEGKFKMETPEDYEYAYRMTVRKDRRPLDTDIEDHRAVDEFLKLQYGIAGRSQTVFVTGDDYVAEGYGEVFLILPRGEFKFLWSPDIGDLAGINIPRGEEMIDVVERSEFRTDDLHEAIQSGHEIMLDCKDYYAIKDSHSMRRMIKILIAEM